MEQHLIVAIKAIIPLFLLIGVGIYIRWQKMLTDTIVKRDHLTTLMITHNMRDALRFGNRLIMMHEGRVLIDVDGEEKKNLKIADLLAMFEKASGDGMASDKLLLG